MPTFALTAINIGGFPLGEADKVVYLFSSERGLSRAVAKGARKPGTKMSGKSEALCANRLLLAKGKSFDIITQAESINTFSKLRTDLVRLTYGLYYAELTQALAQGLELESEEYYQLLYSALEAQEQQVADARLLCIEFELRLLRMLGLSPEFRVCVKCRRALTENNVAIFLSEMGGVGCTYCAHATDSRGRANKVAESGAAGESYRSSKNEGADISDRYPSYESRRDSSGYIDSHGEYEERGTFLTPLVWKMLVACDASSENTISGSHGVTSIRRREFSEAQTLALEAGRRLLQRYLEDRAGKRMKALDLLQQISQ